MEGLAHKGLIKACTATLFKQSNLCSALRTSLAPTHLPSCVTLQVYSGKCLYAGEQANKQGLTFDAATVVTATQDAEVYKLVSSELEALQHLLVVILLDGQLGRLCSTQVPDEPRCGKCQCVHILCGYCIHLHPCAVWFLGSTLLLVY